MEAEPADQFFTNMAIYNLLQEREQDEAKLRELEAKNRGQ
jgi:hypothetical protein